MHKSESTNTQLCRIGHEPGNRKGRSETEKHRHSGVLQIRKYEDRRCSEYPSPLSGDDDIKQKRQLKHRKYS